MKVLNLLICTVLICVAFSSCFKDPPEEPYFYPWQCTFDVTRNGKEVVITDGTFWFSDWVSPFFLSDADSILTIVFSNTENDPHSESIHLSLIPEERDDFLQIYDINKLSEHLAAVNIIFKEWHTPLAYYELDFTYPNKVEIISISEDKKTISGTIDIRMLLPKKDKQIPGQWAPDTISYNNGSFVIKSLE